MKASYLWLLPAVLGLGYLAWRRSQGTAAGRSASDPRIPESIPRDYTMPDTAYTALDHLLQLDPAEEAAYTKASPNTPAEPMDTRTKTEIFKEMLTELKNA